MPAITHSPPRHLGLLTLCTMLATIMQALDTTIANVALPSIGAAFDSSQTALDLIAVGYSLGLAASVLYLGALGDRYGRKLMLILGTALAVPMSLLADHPNVQFNYYRKGIGNCDVEMH